MKLIDKDALVAEINRLIAELVEEGEGTMFEQGRISAFEDMEILIDTLQEDPVSEDLEETCEQLAENARKHKAETLSPFFSQTDYKQGVIDGANWQLNKIRREYEKNRG